MEFVNFDREWPTPNRILFRSYVPCKLVVQLSGLACHSERSKIGRKLVLNQCWLTFCRYPLKPFLENFIKNEKHLFQDDEIIYIAGKMASLSRPRLTKFAFLWRFPMNSQPDKNISLLLPLRLLIGKYLFSRTNSTLRPLHVQHGEYLPFHKVSWNHCFTGNN